MQYCKVHDREHEFSTNLQLVLGSHWFIKHSRPCSTCLLCKTFYRTFLSGCFTACEPDERPGKMTERSWCVGEDSQRLFAGGRQCLNNVKKAAYSVVFGTSESWLKVERWRQMLSKAIDWEKLNFIFAVDEAPVLLNVQQWWVLKFPNAVLNNGMECCLMANRHLLGVK